MTETGQSMLDQLIERLDPQQRAAVTAPFDQHCLVLAGAGCGKTMVLTRRIALCAHAHCPQDRILALTFTKKAAREMRERVLSLPGIQHGRGAPFVTTFHGFGLSVLRDTIEGSPNAEMIGYGREPTLMNQRQRLEGIARVSTRQERRELRMSLFELESALASLEVNPAKLAYLPEGPRVFLRELSARLAEEKRKRSLWEFSDMILLCLNLLERYPQRARHYAEKYAYILVDEFQDTNPLQVRLLKRLIGDGNRVFAVGDDDQAIYGFRGADIGPITSFESHFAGAQVVKLEVNYRSMPAVLDTANRIFIDKPVRYRKTLRSGRYGSSRKESGPKPRKLRFRALQDMCAWIVARGIELANREQISLASMAVLFRVNESLDQARRELVRQLGTGDEPPQFLTVHASKGLEFPVVFLCDLEESVFPSYRLQRSSRIRTWGDLIKRVISRRSRSPHCDLQEERRLFYVGVTRAEKHLFLISVRTKELHGRSTALRPSRFLSSV